MSFDVSVLAETYAMILGHALPIALVFGLSNMIVDTVLLAAFTGKLKIGGRG